MPRAPGQSARDALAADLERSNTHLEPVGHSRQSSASLATKGSACVKVRGAKSLPGGQALERMRAAVMLPRLS